MKNSSLKLLCLHPNVKGVYEWDKANLPEPMGLLQEENAVSVSIQKNPELGRRLRINVASRTGFTDAETKRHESAMILLEVVVNSLEFKTAALKLKYTTTKKTAQQVYDLIMTGEEVLQKGVDYEIDISVIMYSKNNNVVGYTYSNVITTWLNRYVTKNYSEEELAGNAFHEWLHKLGFGHASASDHSSVPYALGYLVRDLIKRYKKGEKFTDLYPDVIVVNPPTVEDPKPELPTEVIPVPVKEPVRVCYRPWWGLFLIKKCYYEK